MLPSGGLSSQRLVDHDQVHDVLANSGRGTLDEGWRLGRSQQQLGQPARPPARSN